MELRYTFKDSDDYSDDSSFDSDSASSDNNDNDNDESREELCIRLQPFHRTLRDFVFGNPEFAALVTETEKTYNDDFFFRIAFTNVWFSCIDFFDEMNQDLGYELGRNIPAISPDIVLRAFEHNWALELFHKHSSFIMKTAGLNAIGLCTKLTWSLPHFAVTKCDALPAHRLMALAKTENETMHTDTLSPLYSVALGRDFIGPGNRESLPELLRRLSPNGRFALTHRLSSCEYKKDPCPGDLGITVWMAISMSWPEIAERIYQRSNHEGLSSVGNMLCDFIKAGADCNFFILHRMLFSSGISNNLYAVSAPEILLIIATLLDQEITRESDSWREQIARLLEGVELTMPRSDEWAQRGIDLVDDQERRRLQERGAFVYRIVCGLARGVRKTEDGSISLEVTWTEDYVGRLY